jgi:hypothetical protein
MFINSLNCTAQFENSDPYYIVAYRILIFQNFLFQPVLMFLRQGKILSVSILQSIAHSQQNTAFSVSGDQRLCIHQYSCFWDLPPESFLGSFEFILEQVATDINNAVASNTYLLLINFCFCLFIYSYCKILNLSIPYSNIPSNRRSLIPAPISSVTSWGPSSS